MVNAQLGFSDDKLERLMTIFIAHIANLRGSSDIPAATLLLLAQPPARHGSEKIPDQACGVSVRAILGRGGGTQSRATPLGRDLKP